MARKRLAIHTNIGKRSVAVAFANSRDPYGLCAPHDELRKEYFVLDSDSTTWIAFRDLPPVTEEVMRTSIAYVVVNYDDWLHEAADLYDLQINDFLQRRNPTPELRIVCEIKRIF